jgi:hypothetical protein
MGRRWKVNPSPACMSYSLKVGESLVISAPPVSEVHIRRIGPASYASGAKRIQPDDGSAIGLNPPAVHQHLVGIMTAVPEATRITNRVGLL